MKYAIYDAKMGIYWDAPSIGLSRYHDTQQSAIDDWESDNPPKTLQKQQISFHSLITDEWCVPSFYKQCRFFIHEVDVNSDFYQLILHNTSECEYEKLRNNKYGRTTNHKRLCAEIGIKENSEDKNNPFINNLHR